MGAYQRSGFKSRECPDEPQFDEIFKVLGNKEAQEAIRKEHPGKHCELLLFSPNACQGCPKNPRGGIKGEDLDLLEEYAWLLAAGYQLWQDWQLGAIDAAQLSEPDRRLLLETMEWQKEREAKRLAARIIEMLVESLGDAHNIRH